MKCNYIFKGSAVGYDDAKTLLTDTLLTALDDDPKNTGFEIVSYLSDILENYQLAEILEKLNYSVSEIEFDDNDGDVETETQVHKIEYV